MARGQARRAKAKAYPRAITLDGRPSTTVRGIQAGKGAVGSTRFAKRPPRGQGKPQPMPSGKKPSGRVPSTRRNAAGYAGPS